MCKFQMEFIMWVVYGLCIYLNFNDLFQVRLKILVRFWGFAEILLRVYFHSREWSGKSRVNNNLIESILSEHSVDMMGSLGEEKSLIFWRSKGFLRAFEGFQRASGGSWGVQETVSLFHKKNHF